MKKRVVITGLGVVSSLGIGREAFWENITKGVSGISPVTSFDTSNHITHNGGEIKNFKPEQYTKYNNTYGRTSYLALSAARLALKDANLNMLELPDEKSGLCIGTTTGAVQTIEFIDNDIVKKKISDKTLFIQLPTHSTLSDLASELNISGPTFMFSTACAAGNYAIGYGYDLIKLNKSDLVLSGAADPFSRISFTGFNQFSAVAPEKCQPFDKNRKGMMVAEGAGILVLESLEHATARGADIYAEVLGYGLSCDAKHMTNPSIEGVSRCMNNAIINSGISPDEVDYISAHGTGTVANDKTECFAIKEVFKNNYKNIPVSSIKSMLGHTMGAASALEAIACVLAARNNIIPPTINYESPDPQCDIDCVPNRSREHVVNVALNNSYAFGGNNASLAIQKFI